MSEPPRSTPRRVTRLISDTWFLRALVGAAVLSGLLSLLVIWVQAYGTPTDQQVAITALVNLVAVVGLQTFMGNSGVVSFGHVAFVGLGAYASALLTTAPETKRLSTLIPHAPGFILDAHLSFLPATLVAVAVVMAIALVVGVVFTRMSGAVAAIATLSLLVITRVVLGNWSQITRGPKTFFGVPSYTTIWWALGWSIAVIVVARLFRESRVGLRLRASRNDLLASRAVGVDVMRGRLAAWVLSAGMAAASGALYAHLILAFAPQQFYFDLTFLLIVMAIVGGPTVSGAVVGVTAISVVTEFLRRQEDGFHLGPLHIHQAFGLTTLVLGVLVLATVILRPDGLLGRWEIDEWFGRLRARLRRRKRITSPGSATAADDARGPGLAALRAGSETQGGSARR